MEKSSSLKKAPLKILKVLDPIKTSPFVVPTIRKEAPTGSIPIWNNPLQAVTNRFPQVEENQTTEAPEVVFDLPQGEEGVETPPPNDSLKPPSGCLHSFRRDWQTNKCSNNLLNIVIITNGYVLTFISKPKLARVPLIHIQGPSKRPSSGRLNPVSSVKERNRKGGKCKVSGFTVCF